MTYTCKYTDTTKVEYFSNVAAANISDVALEFAEDRVDSALKEAGIDPSGVTDTYGDLQRAATFLACHYMVYGKRSLARGMQVSSESVGGVSISYQTPSRAHDWLSLAMEEIGSFIQRSLDSDRPTMVRKNFNVEEWETENFVETTEMIED